MTMQSKTRTRITIAVLMAFLGYAIALLFFQRRFSGLLDRVMPSPDQPPDMGVLPQRSAPRELTAATVPDDSAAIAAVFARLPNEAAGLPRAAQFDQMGPDRYSAAYGEIQEQGVTASIHAIDISAGQFYPPGWNAGQVIATWAGGDESQVVSSGRENGLGWVRWNDTFENEQGDVLRISIINWGKATSPWLFGAQADSPEKLDALLAAYAEAVKST
jgi:hypothetical protein